jgi:integrase
LPRAGGVTLVRKQRFEPLHPNVVQERLVHERIGITLDLYTHVLPSMQQQATASLDRLFAATDAKAHLQCG